MTGAGPRRSLRYTDVRGRRQTLTFTQWVYLDIAGRGFTRGWGGLDSTLTVRLLRERGVIVLDDFGAPAVGRYAWRVTGRTALGDQLAARWHALANPEPEVSPMPDPYVPLDIQAAGTLLDNFAAAVEDQDDAAVTRVRRILMDQLTSGAASAATLPPSAKWPLHGVGSLGHGATAECDLLGGESCNNGQCRQQLGHDRCTPECTALVVWDHNGAPWQPDAPNLADAGPGELLVLADLIAQGGPRPGDLP